MGNFGIIQLRLRNASGSENKEDFRISQVGEKKLYFVPGITLTGRINAAELVNADGMYSDMSGKD